MNSQTPDGEGDSQSKIQNPKSKMVSDGQLLALTPAIVKRAKQGLTAAQNSAVRGSIQSALTELQQIVAGKPERRVQGKFRRRVLRWAIHLLFRVRVDFPEKIGRAHV